MRRILVIDKDREERPLISDLHVDVETLHAETLQEARDHLKNEVDAVVADLRADASVEVLAHLRSSHPTLPALLLSDTVETAISLDGLPLLPPDATAEQLVVELDAALNNTASNGVSLPQLLQVVALQGCTCSVRVSAGARQGSIHFSAGELTDAYLFDEQLDGEAAALEILTWSDPKAEVREARPSQDRFITKSLLELLGRGETAEAQSADETEAAQTEQDEDKFSDGDETTLSANETEAATPEPLSAASLADNPALAHLLESSLSQPSVTLPYPNQALTAAQDLAAPSKEIPVADLRQALEQEAQTLQETFQALQTRAREADEALADVMSEVEAFREQQQRYQQAEVAFNERQERLEQLRSGAEALAQQLLSVVKQVDEEAPDAPTNEHESEEVETA